MCNDNSLNSYLVSGQNITLSLICENHHSHCSDGETKVYKQPKGCFLKFVENECMNMYNGFEIQI